MLFGNVRAALALLDTILMDHPWAPLHLNDPVSSDNPFYGVLDELQAKHPSGQPASEEVLLSPSSSTTSFHPVVFNDFYNFFCNFAGANYICIYFLLSDFC